MNNAAQDSERAEEAVGKLLNQKEQEHEAERSEARRFIEEKLAGIEGLAGSSEGSDFISEVVAIASKHAGNPDKLEEAINNIAMPKDLDIKTIQEVVSVVGSDEFVAMTARSNQGIQN